VRRYGRISRAVALSVSAPSAIAPRCASGAVGVEVEDASSRAAVVGAAGVDVAGGFEAAVGVPGAGEAARVAVVADEATEPPDTFGADADAPAPGAAEPTVAPASPGFSVDRVIVIGPIARSTTSRSIVRSAGSSEISNPRPLNDATCFWIRPRSSRRTSSVVTSTSSSQRISPSTSSKCASGDLMTRTGGPTGSSPSKITGCPSRPRYMRISTLPVNRPDWRARRGTRARP